VAYLRTLSLTEQTRRRKQLMDYLEKKRRFWKFEKEALRAKVALEEAMDLWQDGLQNA